MKKTRRGKYIVKRGTEEREGLSFPLLYHIDAYAPSSPVKTK